MTAPTSGFAADLAALVADYRAHHNIAHLKQHLQSLARQATPDAVIVAAEPYRDDPEIVAPLYEAVVEAQPDNARALVMLANAYWLLGLGPDVVSELANRAIVADIDNELLARRLLREALVRQCIRSADKSPAHEADESRADVKKLPLDDVGLGVELGRPVSRQVDVPPVILQRRLPPLPGDHD